MQATAIPAQPVIIGDGAQPALDLIELFESRPSLWARVRDAVASVLPEQPRRQLALKYPRFRSKHVLGYGYWGFVYPTAVPRWVVKVSCDPQAGQIATTLLSTPKLRTHPGICFMLAAWELPGYLVDTSSGHTPITVTVREELPNMLWGDPYDGIGDDLVDLSQLARRFNDAELLRQEAVEYQQWYSAWAYAAQRRADYRGFLSALKRLSRHRELTAVCDFLKKYRRTTGEMLVDITRPNLGWRVYDTQDAGGPPPGAPFEAVIRDAEHTGGMERPRPDYLPNP